MIAWITMGFAAIALAQDPTPAAPDPFAEPWALARDFERAGYADIGAAEVMRALHRHPGHPDAGMHRLRLSRFQRKNGHFRAEQGVLLAGREQQPQFAHWFELVLADTLLQRREFGALVRSVGAVGIPKAAVRSEMAYFKAWGHVGAGEPTAALAALSRVDGDLAGPAAAFSDDLAHWDEVRRRSPGVAAGLSVVPGLGHVYAGRPGSGLLYAATVAAMVAGSVVLIRDERPVPGALLGVAAVSAWASTMADGHAAVRSFNAAQRQARLEALQQRNWVRTELADDPRRPVVVVVAPPEPALPGSLDELMQSVR